MEGLETITSSLMNAFDPDKHDTPLDISTLRTSAEITTERRTDRTDNALRNKWFYTANFGMYSMEDGEAVLYFGGRESNPILGNLDEACNQLIHNNNYRVTDVERQTVVESVEQGHTLKVKLSDLGLHRHSDEFSYFEIDTENYDSLNESQRAMAEAVYGSGQDFIDNMQMLRNSTQKIKKTRVYVLNEDYVKEHAQDETIARASWLDSFDSNLDFYASDRGVGDNGALRGVLLIREADTQKIEEFYSLVGKPIMQQIAVRALNPQRAAILSNMLTQYLSNPDHQG